MTSLSPGDRRLSPQARMMLGVFARYATIIGLVLMIITFSLLSPRAFPTLGNFTNVLSLALASVLEDVCPATNHAQVVE